jgi:Cu/Ag efflux pump CusA
VIRRVKQKLHDAVQPTLPKGVEVRIVYDRSQLIEHSVATLRQKLIEESVIVSIVCVVFLFHFRSALVAVLTLPLAILLALLAMWAIGLTSNIMSLGGIAIAIGVMVDASIVMIENALKHIEHEQAKSEGERRSRTEVIIEAAKEVGPSLFFSLLIITVSFLPVFTLEDQEGRLFKPLAYTKSFSMGFAALLAITVTPFLMTLLIRGRIPPEDKNPINRLLIWLYHSVARLTLRWRYTMILLAVPFSLVGAFLLLYLLNYNLSVAVWVGIIALAGVDAETGVIMLLYLDVAHDRRKREGRMNNLKDLEEAVLEGPVQRVRPKMMTVMAILMGLLPIMWSTGTGADVMKRIAAPMVGGIVTSFIMELLIYPAVYTIWKWWAEVRWVARPEGTAEAAAR